MNHEKMKKIREERGLSRSKLAELTGLGMSTIGTYERGGSAPDGDALAKICRALNVSADALLDLEPQEATDAQKDEVRAIRSLAEEIAALDYNAKYQRNTLPVIRQVMELLLLLVQSTDESLAEVRETAPTYTPGTLSAKDRLAYVAADMVGDPIRAGNEWLEARTAFANKVNSQIVNTSNQIRFLLSMDMLSRLLSNE